MGDQLLQPIPPGLLSLLGLKQRGQAPNTLGDTVVPTIELFDWYGVNDREVFEGLDTTSLASGTRYMAFLTFAATTLVVPSGEVWRVHDYVVNVGLPATTTSYDVEMLAAGAFLPMRGNNNTLGQMIGPQGFTTPFTPINAGSGYLLVAPSMRGFWAPAGTQFGFYFAGAFIDAAAGAATVKGLAHITRLKV